MKTAEIITVSNGKGGVTKTTTCKLLIYELLARGKKVLAIDMDSKQCNLTIGFDIDPYPSAPKSTDVMSDAERERLSYLAYNGEHNLVKIFQGGVKPTPMKAEFVDNLWIIPAARELEAVANACSSSKDLKLKQYLKTVEDDFDYIVIDTNPGITVLINNAVIYADKIVMPAQAEGNAAEGMKSQLSDIGSLVAEYDSDKVNHFFVVPAMVSRTSKVHQHVMENFEDGLLSHIKSIPSLKNKSLVITEPVYQKEIFRKSDLTEGIYFVQQYIEEFDSREKKLHKDDLKNGTNEGLLTALQNIGNTIIDSK